MADEKEKTNLEHLGEETKNAIGSANLMQGLMGQIYDIFTTGGDVANASEDNFFCWLTPGVPVTPEQFEFATEGLSGVIRAKTPSQRKASQASEDAMDHVVNQIIKRRVEEIANRQMAVETDDAHPDEEERRRRAKELEAQKAKEASQQDTDPKLAAVKALGDAKEAEAAPEAEATDVPEAPATLSEAAAEEAEKITYDKVPVSDEGFIVNQETEGLSEADLEALKAERTTLLYMQAENFANMVNFIPDVSGRSDKEKTGLAVLENEGSLVDVYSRVLMMSEVAHYELDEKAKERLAKARSVLTTTVMKATDLLSDEKTPVEVDSPYVEAYNAKMAAYIDACLEYNNRRIAAGAGGDARAVHDWALNASLYRLRVNAAMDAWVNQGYKNQIEQISAEIASLTEKDLSLLKAQYKEILQRSMMTGLVSGIEFPFTTISPANFAHASSWTDFTFSMQRYKDHNQLGCQQQQPEDRPDFHLLVPQAALQLREGRPVPGTGPGPGTDQRGRFVQALPGQHRPALVQTFVPDQQELAFRPRVGRGQDRNDPELGRRQARGHSPRLPDGDAHRQGCGVRFPRHADCAGLQAQV